jgi:hypothetical protein
MTMRWICLFSVLSVVGATAVLSATEVEKKVFIPDEVWNTPKGNDYDDPESEFSFARMAESANLAVFWAKEFGNDPQNDPDPKKRINLKRVTAECERFYKIYIEELGFVDEGHSVTDDYKILVYILGGDGGTAYGGAAGEKIGVLWTPLSRIGSEPYGALAHELGHSFQFLTHADGNWAFSSPPVGATSQPIFEMTSQFMLWQVYPEWMTFENYHLNDFMKKTHYAFLHETNQYHSPYVLEYWGNKHGADFIGKLWREAREGEDVVEAYKRLTSTNQEKFNDEMFDASRRFMTWDIPRIREVAAPYANQHSTELVLMDGGWFQIAESRVPQNYGYNGIKLEVPKVAGTLKLEFEGMAGAKGFRSIKVDRAGWRYGFVAMDGSGKRHYSETFSDPRGTVTFTIPEGAEHLWLVVSGAPEEHWQHIADQKDENDEQWPYRFRLTGTKPDASVIK